MKRLTYTAFVVAQLFAVVLFTQSQNVFSQKPPRKIQFAKLSEYVNDWDKRRDGEVLIVTEVPALGLVHFQKSNNLYFFQPDETGDVGNTFYTSATLAKSLRQYLKKGAYTERIYCTLVQFVGSSDVYRSPFATKVEGFDENGQLSWTARGPSPAKLKISQ